MKLAVKEIALRHGLHATFMARPSNDPECAPSGFHLHQSLLDARGNNVFEDRACGGSLSETARHYAGGQLAHADGITGVAAATVTAYKRYRPGTWAPMRAGWGIDNRSAMVRAILAGEDTRLENRLGASCANPYLIAAAPLAAGLHGIHDRIEPGEPASHDIVGDDRYPLVPLNLLDGIRALAADAVLTEALGSEFSRLYVSVLRGVWDRYQAHVTDWEIAEYREVL